MSIEDIKLAIWFVSIVGGWIGSFVVVKMQTKANVEKIEKLEGKIEKLEAKDTISSKDAYNSFVSKEMLELHLKNLENKIDNLVDLMKGAK